MTEQRDPAASGDPVDRDPRVEATTGGSVPPTDQGGAVPPPTGVPGDAGAGVETSDPLKTEPKPPSPFDDAPTRSAAPSSEAMPPGTPAAADPGGITPEPMPTPARTTGDLPPGTPKAAEPTLAQTPPADPPVEATAPMDPAEMTTSESDQEVTAPGAAVKDEDLDREAERLAARAAERAERNRALGKVERPAPEPPPVVLTTQVRTTDKWHGSLGLFVLRIVLGAIMFIHGIQHLTSIGDTQQFVAQSTVLPYPEILGWVLGIGEVLIAIALIFGFLVRVAGVGAMAIGVMALAFVLWGAVNPFQPDMPGFIGELELLIVGVGFLFLMVGGGRWGVDGALRARRRLKKEAAASNN